MDNVFLVKITGKVWPLVALRSTFKEWNLVLDLKTSAEHLYSMLLPFPPPFMSEVPENHTAQSISEEQTVGFVYHSHALVNAQQIVDRPVPINA